MEVEFNKVWIILLHLPAEIIQKQTWQLTEYDQLLLLADGKKVMCVKMWRKEDFEKLKEKALSFGIIVESIE